MSILDRIILGTVLLEYENSFDKVYKLLFIKKTPLLVWVKSVLFGLIILEFNKKPIGFIVDEVTEVLRISKKTLNDVPDMVSTKMNTDYIKSIANIEDKIIILLDLQNLLSGINF